MKKKEKIGIASLILVSLFGIFFLNSQFILKESSQTVLINNKIQNVDYSIAKTFLEINGEKYEAEINGGASVYNFMDKLRSEGKINFKEKNYSGIGKFIEEINGVKGNGDKYWIYYVNGKKAKVGVSDYKLNIGDIVSWKYEKNIY